MPPDGETMTGEHNPPGGAELAPCPPPAAPDRLDRTLKIVLAAITILTVAGTISFRLLSADFVTRAELTQVLDARDATAEKFAIERADAFNKRLDALAATTNRVYELLLNERRGSK